MSKKDDKDAIKTAWDGVANGIELSSFSPEGKLEFKKSISKYMNTLYDESNKTAGRQGLKQVSDDHVKWATHYLARVYENPNLEICHISGTLILGGSIGGIVLISGRTPFIISSLEFWVIIGTFVIGLFLEAIYFVKRY